MEPNIPDERTRRQVGTPGDIRDAACICMLRAMHVAGVGSVEPAQGGHVDFEVQLVIRTQLVECDGLHRHRLWSISLVRRVL